VFISTRLLCWKGSNDESGSARGDVRTAGMDFERLMVSKLRAQPALGNFEPDLTIPK
jgi:hypothetical protein